MKKVGLLGCGKIGRAIMKRVLETGHQISFVQDPFFGESADFPVITSPDSAVYDGTDLVVECATAAALKESFEKIIAVSDMLIFSVTAFSDPVFQQRATAAAAASGHHIYFPHGAILGLDGIADAAPIMTAASIETTKSPKSLGLDLTERTVVFDGCTRDACAAFPRNVNVHAAVALAGIEGEGIHFTIEVSSFTTGGVTGVYTPLSACGSIDRLLANGREYAFI